MKIKSIHIENFKSIKKLNFSPDQTISILIGKNNVGKSNILDVFLMIGEVLRRGETLRNIYREVVYGKDSNLRIVFDLYLMPLEEEIRNLYPKLNLNEANFDRFNALISNGLRYKVQLGLSKPHNEPILLEEELFIYDDQKEIQYAKGYWDESRRMYSREIVKNLTEGLSSENWQRDGAGGGSPPTSILYDANYQTGVEWQIPFIVWEFITNITKLNSFRESPERGNIIGEYKLASDAKNLPQLLNTLASSNRLVFDTIIKDLCKIIEEVSDIRAPVVKGETTTYLGMTEHQFKRVEFLWKNISSGTKEILYLLTLLHTAERGSLLLIEEPELHLHGQAIEKLLGIMREVAKRDQKQILMTTHSPMFVDCVPFEELFIVLRGEEGTEVIALRDFKGIVDELFVKAGIPLGYVFLTKLPSLILVVEGRDDLKIWSQFLKRFSLSPEENRITIVSGFRDGGCKDVIQAGEFLQKVRIPIPYLLLLDSDYMEKELQDDLKKRGFNSDDYFVLSQKEIEEYLLDAKAISELTGKKLEDVEKILSTQKGHGKEKLENVFRGLGLSPPKAETKELLILHLKEIPDDIKSALNRIKEKISRSR